MYKIFHHSLCKMFDIKISERKIKYEKCFSCCFHIVEWHKLSCHLRISPFYFSMIDEMLLLIVRWKMKFSFERQKLFQFQYFCLALKGKWLIFYHLWIFNSKKDIAVLHILVLLVDSLWSEKSKIAFNGMHIRLYKFMVQIFPSFCHII